MANALLGLNLPVGIGDGKHFGHTDAILFR